MEQIRLPDLETIRRFSIAVRSEHADVEDVIEALRIDLQTLLEATGRLRGGRPKSVARPAEADPEDEDDEEPQPQRSSGVSSARRAGAARPPASMTKSGGAQPRVSRSASRVRTTTAAAAKKKPARGAKGRTTRGR